MTKEQWFEKRTQAHIKLVQEYAKCVFAYDPLKFEDILENVKTHDASKFEEPQREPYIWITDKYKCESEGLDFDPPEGMEDQMHDATERHVKSEPHHPEYFSDQTDVINKEDRDEVKEVIDATKMPDIFIGEMICDWCAVSEERHNTPKKWADKNIDKRWKFTPEQKVLIYDLIDAIWDDEDYVSKEVVESLNLLSTLLR